MTTRTDTCANPTCEATFIDTSPNQMRIYCSKPCKIKAVNARRRIKHKHGIKPPPISPHDTARLHELLAHEQAGTRPPRVHIARGFPRDKA